METNFESTYGQKQNNFRKTQALLPTKTNKQEDKSRETYSKKTTTALASLNSA